jgi:hypothetical protein
MSKILYFDLDVGFPWLKFVHTSLDSLCLSSNWIFQTVISVPHLKKIISVRIEDQFTLSWQTSVYESDKCQNYRTFKLNKVLKIIKDFTIRFSNLHVWSIKYQLKQF